MANRQASRIFSRCRQWPAATRRRLDAEWREQIVTGVAVAVAVLVVAVIAVLMGMA